MQMCALVHEGARSSRSVRVVGNCCKEGCFIMDMNEVVNNFKKNTKKQLEFHKEEFYVSL